MGRIFIYIRSLKYLQEFCFKVLVLLFSNPNSVIEKMNLNNIDYEFLVEIFVHLYNSKPNSYELSLEIVKDEDKMPFLESILNLYKES